MYDIIKKQNGELFAREIRNFDGRIFDIPNLQEVVQYAGRDAKRLAPFLASLLNVNEIKVQSELDPFELLKKAGYNAFYADTEKKKNSIKHYYANKEAICTFRDSERHKNYHIIHCIKEGADKLKRSDFKGHEDRQDEYGTSVISIQILKSGGFISIKNRYNHTVQGCDQTFDSNPDNIVLGLSDSLKKYFKVDFFTAKEHLPWGFIMVDKKILRVYHEEDNVYFGGSFYVKNGEVIPIQKDYQFFYKGFLFDLKAKKVSHFFGKNQKFVDLLNQEMRDKTIQRKKTFLGFDLLLDGKEFLSFNEDYDVIGARFVRAQHLPNHSFEKAEKLMRFEAPNLKTMGDNCLTSTRLFHLSVPHLVHMGRECFYGGCFVEKLVFDNLKSMGEACFFGVHSKEFIAPNLKSVSKSSLGLCDFEKIYAPKVQMVAFEAICQNKNLKTLFLPKCMQIGYDAITICQNLETLHLPRLKYVAHGAVSCNDNLKKVYVPKLVRSDSCSFGKNHPSLYVEAPALVQVGYNCFERVNHLYAPYLRLNNEALNRTNFNILNTQFVKESERLLNRLSFGLLNFMRGKQRGR